jgi:hypothetical protein
MVVLIPRGRGGGGNLKRVWCLLDFLLPPIAKGLEGAAGGQPHSVIGPVGRDAGWHTG